ncbi:MAG TPA: TIGR03435 family protein [Vicinamibacterales bacterium]|nr:TIGR03435 family protein [Vicinamibacterales bacterium]
MRFLTFTAVGLCLSVASVQAQRPEFEVATVKASATVPLGTSISINLGTFRNGTLTMTNVTLGECIQFGHALVSQDQVAGPDWVKSRETRFDIVAKAAAGTDLDGARLMLQSLLADRLKLATRTERRPFTFVAVVPAKGGSKLMPSKEGETTPGSGAPGRITGSQMPIAVLASLLSRFEGQLFVDKTGLTGRYQITLEWAPENDPNRNGPSLAEALERQLGLRMERRREPLDVIVVEKAEQIPTDN